MHAEPTRRVFTATDGTEIVFWHWPTVATDGTANSADQASPDPENPTPRVVQLLHGLGEHARRYDVLVAALVASGWSVYATDHRGHGQTGAGMLRAGQIARMGKLGRGGMAAVFADERQLRELIGRENPGAHVTLLGHSWGSMIAQRLLATEQHRYARVVLSGSTLLLPGVLPSGGFNRRWRSEPGATGFEWLSRDPAVAQAFLADPLTFGNSALDCFGLAGSLQLLGTPPRPKPQPGVGPGVPGATQPSVLLLAGEVDPIGGAKGTALLERAFRRAGWVDVRSRVYPGARHEVFNELCAAQVIADLLGWLSR